MGEPLDSMCAVYAHLVRSEIQSDTPDQEKMLRFLGYIEEHCSVAPYEKGETPEHLEKHLFDDGIEEAGTVEVDGEEMPASAAARLK